MAFSLDSAFGIHEQALTLRARRAELLAANLANADTPNFKARDLDFSKLLGGAMSDGDLALSGTHHSHVDGTVLGADLEPAYRVSTQPSLDGNTVDTQVEQSKFLENALAYQTSLTFLSQRIRGLELAIRGE